MVRQGRRAASKTLVLHLVGGSPSGCVKSELMASPRVGLVVGKVVGNAVQRNRVKRQLRHAARLRLAQLAGLSVVIRANPASASATSAELRRDFDRCLARTRDGSR